MFLHGPSRLRTLTRSDQACPCPSQPGGEQSGAAHLAEPITPRAHPDKSVAVRAADLRRTHWSQLVIWALEAKKLLVSWL